MPSIKDSRKTIKTSIPSIEGSEVVLYNDLTGGDLTRIENLGLQNAQTRAMQTLFSLLKSWNLDEELNFESVVSLELSDQLFLLEQTDFYKRGLDEDGNIKKNLIIEGSSKA